MRAPTASPIRVGGADRAALIARYPRAVNGSLPHRIATIAVVTLLVGLTAFALGRLEFSPGRVFSGSEALINILGLMVPPDPGSWSRAMLYLNALGETVAIAILGTCGAAVLALPLGLMAARNTLPVWLIRFLSRRGLDTLRGVDTLIWALIWINVVGLGPFAGVLAILTSDLGAFGKLYSEAIEAADRRAVEGVRASGGSRLQIIRFGIIPQVLPVMASQVLYFIESNTRSATIIGIVGAGGIGLHLYEQIRTLEWQQVSFIIVLILFAVALIDAISSRLRFAIIGRRDLGVA